MAGSRDTAANAAACLPRRPWAAISRLVQLHLISRRIPAALVAIVACGALFQATLRWHGDEHSLQVPLIIEAAAASVVAVTAASPFDESERATGTSLPYLRVGAAVGVTMAAFASLLAGAAGAHLLGGAVSLLRNVFGIAGVGLLSAAVIGGSLSWICPLAYLALAEEALSAGWHTPWIWPARPPGDLGGAICAALVFGVGLALISVRGARVTDR
jgi:hypothetical protein